MKETTLEVRGMTCGNCVRHVEEVLKGLEGVGGVRVVLGEGKAFVQHDPDAATVERMVATLDDAGYEARAATA